MKNIFFPNKTEAARHSFPRGLLQPEGSYRFSTDALLLASFARPGKKLRILDLGTGCGVVALAMLCREPESRALGVDIQPELVVAARTNAERLGFAGSFTVVCADLETGLFPSVSAMHDQPAETPRPQSLHAAPRTFDLVLANPPFRQRDSGRLPQSPLRLRALFEKPGTLSAFCSTASRAIGPDGRFCAIYPYERRDSFLAALKPAALAPTRLLPVVTRAGNPPLRLLVEAARFMENSILYPNRPEFEPPLVLHDASTPGAYTKQAVDFCPFLA